MWNNLSMGFCVVLTVVLTQQVAKYRDVFKVACEQALKIDQALSQYLGEAKEIPVGEGWYKPIPHTTGTDTFTSISATCISFTMNTELIYKYSVKQTSQKFAICHESVHFWVKRNWMFDRHSVQMTFYMHISIFYIYMITFLNCRARTPVSCPCEEMFKLWTRDDLEDQKIRRVRTNWTRCWASGQTLGLKTACSSLLRFYIGCQGYPSCRSAIWFPDFVLDASVSDVKCETVSR